MDVSDITSKDGRKPYESPKPKNFAAGSSLPKTEEDNRDAPFGLGGNFNTFRQTGTKTYKSPWRPFVYNQGTLQAAGGRKAMETKFNHSVNMSHVFAHD